MISWAQIVRIAGMPLLGAVLLCPSLARAAEGELARQYRDGALSVLSRLRGEGIQQFGAYEYAVPLERLEKALREGEIRFEEVANFSPREGATRNAAFYVPAEKAVFLNRSAVHDPTLVPFLALHEILGAYGLQDPDYQISIGAYFYLRPQHETELPEIYRARRSLTRGNMGSDAWRLFEHPYVSPAQPANQQLALADSGSGGGGTKVGGGGDGEGMVFKIRFFEAYFAEARFFMPLSILGSGAWLQLELSDEQTIQFERHEVPRPIRKDISPEELEAILKRWPQKLTQSSVRIKVPRKRVREVLAGQRAEENPAVREIFHFLEGYYPTRGLEKSYECGGRLRSYRPLEELHPEAVRLFPWWREKLAAFKACGKKAGTR